MGKATAFSEERAKKILAYLEANHRITVEKAADLCGISNSTARIQLNNLDKKRLLTRTRGGAISREADTSATAVGTIKNLKMKEAIAIAARKTIQEDDIIAIGGGTTTLCLARKLVDAKNIVVITNSIYVAYELLGNRNIEIHLSGGVIRGQNGACLGPKAEEMFNNISVFKSYIGADSISREKGFTTINPDERTERAVLRSAQQKYILCDSSKFSVGPFTEQAASLDEPDYLITDNNAREEDKNFLVSCGIEVILA